MPFSNDILNITTCNKGFIILGDLHAKHHSWNCSLSNTADRVLNNLQPDSPTLYRHSRSRVSSTVDIATSNTTLNLDLKNWVMKSDHRPFICTLKTSRPL